MSTVSTMLSSKQPSSVSSPLLWNRRLCTFGGGRQCRYSAGRSSAPQQKHCDMKTFGRRKKGGQIRAVQVNTVTADGKDIPYRSFLSGWMCLHMGSPIFFFSFFFAGRIERIPTEQRRSGPCHRKRSGLNHSPGNGNAGVSTGDHAALLLGVDHGGVHRQGGTGVHDGAGPGEAAKGMFRESIFHILPLSRN